MEKEQVEQHIGDIIKSLDFKNTDTINFNNIQEAIKQVTGNIPSVTPKWTKAEILNEDRLLGEANKIVEKISEITVVYIGPDNKPVQLKYFV